MKTCFRLLPTVMILLGIGLLVWAYIDCYQLHVAALSEPGTMYCGFLPFGVAYDLIWEAQYAWLRWLCPCLIIGGSILRALLRSIQNKDADD